MNIKRMIKQYISILKLNMAEEPSLLFRLRKIDEIRNSFRCFTCKYLNYVEYLLISDSKVTGCVSISAFASLVCVSGGITSSALGIKICAITAGIKKYNSIIKKKKETW